MARAAVATCQVHRAIRGKRRRNYLVNVVPLYIPEIAHTLGHIFGQDDEVYKTRAGSGNRSTYMWTI